MLKTGSPFSSPGPFCSITSSPNSDIRTYRINVPGTTTVITIYYCAALPIDRDVLGETLTVARIHMSDKINRFGNRALLAIDDPYITPVVEGMNCTLRISSQRVGQTQLIRNHLTYRVALNALRGLHGFLYEGGHAASAVTEVLDPGLTGSMEGIGVISVSHLD